MNDIRFFDQSIIEEDYDYQYRKNTKVVDTPVKEQEEYEYNVDTH